MNWKDKMFDNKITINVTHFANYDHIAWNKQLDTAKIGDTLI